MPIDPRFRELGDLPDRKTADFQDNVANALSRIATQALPKLAPTNLKTADYTSALDDLVIVGASMKVILPVAAAQNNGRVVGVVVQNGTATVTSQSLVQGAATDALSAIGLYIYVSTGTAWWRPTIGGGSISPATTVVTETAFGQAPVVGALVTYAREDHTHGTPTAPVIPAASGAVASETTFGISPAAGAAATFSRGDHTHGSPATPVTSVADNGGGTLTFSAATGAVTAGVNTAVIATAASVADADLSIAAVLDALQFQTRILRDIDEKVALRAGRLPFDGDDNGDTMQLVTSLLVSIDNHLADETGTLPFSEN